MSRSVSIDLEKKSSSSSAYIGTEQATAISNAVDLIQRAFSQVEQARAVEEVRAVASKPVLDPPSPYWRIIENALRLEKLGASLVTLNDSRIEQHFQEIQALEQEEALKLKEAAEAAKSSSFWKFLQDMGSLISAAFSIVIGLPLLFTGAGTIVGGAMIAGGILSITNFIFKETEVWSWFAKKIAGDDEDLARNLESILPATVGVISGIVGIAGAAGAFFFSTLDFGQKIFTVGQTALNLAQGITSIGNGYANARVKWVEAVLYEIDTKSQLHKLKMEHLMTQVQDLFQQQTEVHKQASNILEAEKQSRKIITQQIV